MPEYGQNTQIPVNRANRAPMSGATARGVNTAAARPPTAVRQAITPATTSGNSRYRQNNSTYTKSKPIGGTTADETRPLGDTPETTVAARQDGPILNPPPTAPPAQGSYGQRYNALRQATTAPTSGYSRPRPQTEQARKKPTTASNPSAGRQPGKPLVSSLKSSKLHLPLRPTTATHPRSKKLCRRPFNPDEEENAENTNSITTTDNTKAGTVEFPSTPKVRNKARSVSVNRHERRVNKRSVSRVTKSNGNSNQNYNDSNLHTVEALEKEDSLNIEGSKSKPSMLQLQEDDSEKSTTQLQQGSKKSLMQLQRSSKKSMTRLKKESNKKSALQLQELSKSSMLQDESKASMLKDRMDSSRLQLGSNAESNAAFKDLPNLNLYDLNLSPENGPSIHIDSDPAVVVNQQTLSLNHLRPEYTLKQPKLSSSRRHIENLDGISIEDMTPPAELHNVVSDPKIVPLQSTTPAESITEMKQPDLVGSASEESLPGEASKGSRITNANSYANSSAISTGKIMESEELAPWSTETYISPDDYSADLRSTLLAKSLENVESLSPSSTATASDAHLVDTASEIVPKQEEPPAEETTSLAAPELNCYEIDPLEKYEYLGNLVHIPRQITLTKDSPPLYIGTFPLENTSNENLIFKVKTKTQTASIYAITPKLGTLSKNSTIEVKVQADFSKGMAPSLEMTRNNMVVLLSTAPNTRMTRKDLEKFWKLLQDQQDDGKSSFYIHSIDNIQLADQAGNLVLKEKKSAGAVAKKQLLPVEDAPKPTSPLPEAAGDSGSSTETETDVTLEPLVAAPSNIVNANDIVVTNDPSMASTNDNEPTYEELFNTQVSNEITDDIRNMAGSMNSMLRWGSIAIYVSSLAGIAALLYHNFKDAEPPAPGGVMSALSNSNKDKR